MKLNQRGVAELVVIYVLAGIMALLFIPNPISTSLGMGVKPNKTVQVTSHTERLVPVISVDGKQCPSTYKTVADDKTSDQDIQQHIGFWEWLRSLPILVLLLMGLGIFCPPVALWLHNAWSTLKTDTQKIVLSVDKGLTMLKAKDPVLHAAVVAEIADTQAAPSSAETVVNKAQVGKL